MMLSLYGEALTTAFHADRAWTVRTHRVRSPVPQRGDGLADWRRISPAVRDVQPGSDGVGRLSSPSVPSLRPAMR